MMRLCARGVSPEAAALWLGLSPLILGALREFVAGAGAGELDGFIVMFATIFCELRSEGAPEFTISRGGAGTPFLDGAIAAVDRVGLHDTGDDPGDAGIGQDGAGAPALQQPSTEGTSPDGGGPS